MSAVEDGLVPFGQMTLLRDAMLAADPGAHVTAMPLAGGGRPFVDSNVSHAALDAYHQAERDLVAPFAAPSVTRTRVARRMP